MLVVEISKVTDPSMLRNFSSLLNNAGVGYRYHRDVCGSDIIEICAF